jgi:hypothetical protein
MGDEGARTVERLLQPPGSPFAQGEGEHHHQQETPSSASALPDQARGQQGERGAEERVAAQEGHQPIQERTDPPLVDEAEDGVIQAGDGLHEEGTMALGDPVGE